MKALLFALILSVLVLVNGCVCPPPAPPIEPEPTAASDTAPTTSPTAATDPTEEPTTEATTPITVYENAVEDYLLPIEEFSWERQHAPEFVMIHFTSAIVNHRNDPYNLEYVRAIFVDYDISVHYVIDRDGRIHCYIPEDRVAWHAGEGTYLDDPKYTNTMNQYAIGIEVLAIGSEADMSIYLTPDEYQALDDALKGFTEAQYQALEALVSDLCKRYGIPQDGEHIIGHEDYSPDKTDPGELFDWSRIRTDTPS